MFCTGAPFCYCRGDLFCPRTRGDFKIGWSLTVSACPEEARVCPSRRGKGEGLGLCAHRAAMVLVTGDVNRGACKQTASVNVSRC